MSEDNVRLNKIEQRQDKFEVAMDSIARSLQSLVVLEERHSQTRESLERAFLAIKATDIKIESMEVKVPSWDRSAHLVDLAMIGVCTIVGISLIGLVVVKVV